MVLQHIIWYQEPVGLCIRRYSSVITQRHCRYHIIMITKGKQLRRYCRRSIFGLYFPYVVRTRFHLFLLPKRHQNDTKQYCVLRSSSEWPQTYLNPPRLDNYPPHANVIRRTSNVTPYSQPSYQTIVELYNNTTALFLTRQKYRSSMTWLLPVTTT